MTLSIIGAGFGRTGTDSLKTALDMPVPKQAYPHKNQTDEFYQKIDVLNKAREDGNH